jgi:hypothetical protein
MIVRKGLPKRSGELARQVDRTCDNAMTDFRWPTAVTAKAKKSAEIRLHRSFWLLARVAIVTVHVCHDRVQTVP